MADNPRVEAGALALRQMDRRGYGHLDWCGLDSERVATEVLAAADKVQAPSCRWCDELEGRTEATPLELWEEIIRLRQWKAEALPVLSRWDDVWEALGRPGPLGGFKSDGVLAEIKRREALLYDQGVEDGALNASSVAAHAISQRDAAEARYTALTEGVRFALDSSAHERSVRGDTSALILLRAYLDSSLTTTDTTPEGD